MKEIVKKIYKMILKCLGGHGFKAFGAGSYMKKPIRLIGKKHVSVGEDVSILHNARIEVWPGIACENAELVLEDSVSIEQNFHCVAIGKLIIGLHTTISANVYISDCNHDYTDIEIDAQEQKLIHRNTRIGEYCFIGYGAVILPGTHLGKQCIVGANSVVRPGDYEDFTVLAGVPAKVVKRYNQDTKQWEKIDS